MNLPLTKRASLERYPQLVTLYEKQFDEVVYWLQCKPAIPQKTLDAFLSWGHEINDKGYLLQDYPLGCLAWGEIMQAYSFFHLPEATADYVAEFMTHYEWLLDNYTPEENEEGK